MDHLRVVFETLKNTTPFVNKEKCVYGMDSVNFLAFVISNKRVQVDH